MRRPRVSKWDLLGTLVSGMIEAYLLGRWANRRWGAHEEMKKVKEMGIRV